jgi:aryl sulfotransferase
MTGNRQTVWLASYPKSGNTWLRLLLANLLYADEQPVNINDLPLPEPRVVSRATMDRMTLIDSSLLLRHEVDLLRPDWTRRMLAQLSGHGFVKTHDNYRLNHDNEPIFGRDPTMRALYVVRDPRDVAVSLAHHYGCTLDKGVMYLNESSASIGPQIKRYVNRFDDVLCNWTEHARSWLEQTDMPVHLLRYEDLLAEPVSTLTAAIDFLDLQVTPEAVARAVRFSAFDQLQQQERDTGFRERLKSSTAPFFRAGRAGAWSGVLSAEQARRIVDAHHPLMEQLGYL